MAESLLLEKITKSLDPWKRSNTWANKSPATVGVLEGTAASGQTRATVVSAKFDLEGRMTAHTQTPQLDRWIAATEGISHINMDLSCWWVKTKETFTCFYMEKLTTQDFADENGRKAAHHWNKRTGACLKYKKNGSALDWGIKNRWKTRVAFIERWRLNSACSWNILAIFDPNQKNKEAILVWRYSSAFSWAQAFHLFCSSPQHPNTVPGNLQWQDSALPHPNQESKACSVMLMSNGNPATRAPEKTPLHLI